MSNSSKDQSLNKKGTWKGILIWGMLALLLRWQVIEPRWIPSGSMLPTLQIHDKILVEKISPRLKNTFQKHLQKQTLIVFRPPELLIRTGYDENSALIKRIVGLPGDEVEVNNGILFVNKEPINEPWVKEPMLYEMKPVVVPKDSFWVLGDNRNNSLDSHLWGPLSEKNVIGTAFLRYWPLNKIGLIRVTHQ